MVVNKDLKESAFCRPKYRTKPKSVRYLSPVTGELKPFPAPWYCLAPGQGGAAEASLKRVSVRSSLPVNAAAIQLPGRAAGWTACPNGRRHTAACSHRRRRRRVRQGEWQEIEDNWPKIMDESRAMRPDSNWTLPVWFDPALIPCVRTEDPRERR